MVSGRGEMEAKKKINAKTPRKTLFCGITEKYFYKAPFFTPEKCYQTVIRGTRGQLSPVNVHRAAD